MVALPNGERVAKPTSFDQQQNQGDIGMRKTVLGGIAGVAAATTLIGGGTFAAWSDFNTTESGAGAGILQLEVSSTTGFGMESLTFGDLAPGESKIQDFFVASSAADSVPNGVLSLDLQNLEDIEGHGPGDTVTGVGGNCTTNSERDAESGDPDEIDNDAGVNCGPDGEFSEQAYIQVKAKEVPDSGSCALGSGYKSVGPGVDYARDLVDVVGADQAVINDDVSPGEGTCVRVELYLPETATTDAVQGDSSTFDIRFDLDQKV